MTELVSFHIGRTIKILISSENVVLKNKLLEMKVLDVMDHVWIRVMLDPPPKRNSRGKEDLKTRKVACDAWPS